MKLFWSITLIFIVHTQLTAQGRMDLGENKMRKQINQLIDKAKQAGPKFTLAGTIENMAHNFILINGEKISLSGDERVIGTPKVGSTAKARGAIVNGNKIVELLIVQETQIKRLAIQDNATPTDANQSFDGKQPLQLEAIE